MKKLISKIRFLPLTIFAATLMLTIRVGDIWEGIDSLMDGTINISEAQAQTEQPAEQQAAPVEAQATEQAATAPAAEPAPGEATTCLLYTSPSPRD